MAKRKKKKTDLEPLNTMIDIAGAVALGAITKHQIKKDYKNGHGEEAIKSASTIYGINAMRRGTAGRLALGGLYGVNSAIHDIERKEERKRQQAIQNYQINVRRRTVDDVISTPSYRENDNRYAWRLNCEDGRTYGIDPENYETREAYHNAIRLARGDSGSTSGVKADSSGRRVSEPTYKDISEKMKEYTYCKVSRLDNGKNMYYLSGDLKLNIGDLVCVSDEGGKETQAVVLSVEQHTVFTAPQPPEETVLICKKA